MLCGIVLRFGTELAGDTQSGCATISYRRLSVTHSRFGKGLQRAGLNYGDCFSYAASTWMCPLPTLGTGESYPGRKPRSAMILTLQLSLTFDAACK